MFIPIPAVDIINSKCVRLKEGDYLRKTEYPGSPLEMAKLYESKGFTWMHIVDLDRAKGEGDDNQDIIKQIAQETDLNIQTGGGIRTSEDVESLLKVGVKKVVIGSLAVKKPELIKEWVKKFGADRIIIAADVKDMNIAVSGWQEVSQKNVFDFLLDMQEIGIQEILCTDISKDGMLAGTNVDLYKQIKKQFPNLVLIASGGVATIKDVAEVKNANIEKIVIGKAIFEGRIELEELVELSD